MKKLELKQITVREFDENKDFVKYDSLLKSLVGKNSFCGNSFNLNEISYIKVRNIEKMLKNGAANKKATFVDLSKVFTTAFGVTQDQFFNASVVDFYYAKNYLIQKIIELKDNEAKLLKSINIHAHLWEQAGGDRLNKFGDIMPLVKLGKIYGVYPMDLKHKPYNEIILLLVLHKEDDEVNAAYNKLLNPPVKHR